MVGLLALALPVFAQNFTQALQPGDSVQVTCPSSLSYTATSGTVTCATVVPTSVPTAAPTATPAPSQKPALLAGYEMNQPTYADMSKVKYQPYGQFVNGFTHTDAHWGTIGYSPNGTQFQGWDFLGMDNEGIERIQTDPAFLRLKLNRPAIVAVLWKSATPASWLSGWTDTGPSPMLDWGFCGSSHQCHIYTRVFQAEEADLGGPSADGAEHDVYDVLLAESNGKATTPPAQLGSPNATPNQTCPQWVTSQYVATGKDGMQRQAWAPQIDPVYWCYTRSEHGSNPALFWNQTDPVTGKPFTTTYGAASAAMGMAEAPAGFKNYVVATDAGTWLFVNHFGTSSLQATCESNERGSSAGRFHEVQILYRPKGASEPTIRYTFNGDFGVATDNANPAQRLTPSVCPNQGLDVLSDPSHGSRQIPADSTNPTVDYEPWVANLSMASALGLSGLINFNTLDQGRHCDSTPGCANLDYTGLSGSHRYMEPNRSFAISSNHPSGWFCTDSMGMKAVTCGSAGSLYQYAAAGASASWQYVDDNHFVDTGNQPWNVHGGDAYSNSCREGDAFVECYANLDIHADGGFPQVLEGSIKISGSDAN